MIEENIIKFGTELKPTQASWKSQLYRLCRGWLIDMEIWLNPLVS